MNGHGQRAILALAGLATLVFAKPTTVTTVEPCLVTKPAAHILDDYEALLVGTINGRSTRDDFDKIMDDMHETGHILLPTGDRFLSLIEAPKRPRPGQEWPHEIYMPRAGQAEQPIYAKKIAGEEGKPGLTLILTPGESGDVEIYKDPDKIRGPLHLHRNVHHISMVTEGSGIFLQEMPLEGRSVLLGIPVGVGDVVFIPKNSIHTFWGGQSNFSVLAMSSLYIPSNDAERFQEVIPADQIESLGEPLNYEEFFGRFQDQTSTNN